MVLFTVHSHSFEIRSFHCIVHCPMRCHHFWLMLSILIDKYRDSVEGGPGLKCPVPPLPPLLLDFLQRFLESAGGYRKNSSNPMISRAYQATNGMSIVVEPRTTLFNFGFQTFFPSISSENGVLDSRVLLGMNICVGPGSPLCRCHKQT